MQASRVSRPAGRWRSNGLTAAGSGRRSCGGLTVENGGAVRRGGHAGRIHLTERAFAVPLQCPLRLSLGAGQVLKHYFSKLQHGRREYRVDQFHGGCI